MIRWTTPVLRLGLGLSLSLSLDLGLGLGLGLGDTWPFRTRNPRVEKSISLSPH